MGKIASHTHECEELATNLDIIETFVRDVIEFDKKNSNITFTP